jgi:hypothetical protein
MEIVMSDNISVTFDTNVFGPVSDPDAYSTHPEIEACIKIRKIIDQSKIKPFISEASLSLEALSPGDRIVKLIREWATKNSGIILLTPSPDRINIFQKAFQIGMKVLHVPRIALGAFVEVPEDSWAKDLRIPIKERQDRNSQFTRKFPKIGPAQLKTLGAELVKLHKLDTTGVINFAGWPTPEELSWSKGIIAEFDSPLRFNSQKQFINCIREILADWCDLDILSSHYAYNLDYFCTYDLSKSTGTKGIFYKNNQDAFKTEYGIEFVAPSTLLEILGK